MTPQRPSQVLLTMRNSEKMTPREVAEMRGDDHMAKAFTVLLSEPHLSTSRATECVAIQSTPCWGVLVCPMTLLTGVNLFGESEMRSDILLSK